MSDAAINSTATAAVSGLEEAPVTEPNKIDIDATTNQNSRDAPESSRTAEHDASNDKMETTASQALEGDSEAETLIDSPEKKRRNVVDDAPRLQATHVAGASDDATRTVSGDTDNGSRTRKRKRSEAEETIVTKSPASSHRSSPLSSPVANVATDGSDSDVSVRRSARKADPARMSRHDRGTSQDRGKHTTSRTQIKIHKRRPSDILPHTAKHFNKHETSNIDNIVLTGRRETRSATYPRQTSEERSVSPQPITRREHRRGVSTQLVPQATEKKRRAQPPPINTRRRRSSVSSESDNSPPPSRPRLAKLTSQEHDTLSPAKLMAPRKTRDKNGRTALARAASAALFDVARTSLLERPEELNIADNAGNTPLQIAALEGHVEIVRHLLENDCEVNTKNIDKDTPLIDAVENGHVEVVKLLLEHGADPRMANAAGSEPAELIEENRDRVSQDMRKLLNEYKKRDAKRRQSDDHEHRDNSSRAASAASPRDSPPILGPRSPPLPGARRRTGRSESTRTGLLWVAHTPESLTKLAESGDTGGVVNILNILEKANPEAMLAAAKAGHDDVLELLQAMGHPDPDPDPIRGANIKPGHNTPMLAAIGRGNMKVINLLLNHSEGGKGFDPTRKHHGRTYHEISQERKGHNWTEEYDVLKSAYDRYIVLRGKKHESPRKSKEGDKTKIRRNRDSSSPVAAKHRPQTESPSLTHKGLPEQKTTMRREKRHDASGLELAHDQPMEKPPETWPTVTTSDRDDSPGLIKKTHKARRSQSDLPPDAKVAVGTVQKRRRLVTGKEHRRAAPTLQVDSEEDAGLFRNVKSESTERFGLKRSRSLSQDRTAGNDTAEVAKNVPKKRRTVPNSSSPEDLKATTRKASSQRASSRESSQTIEVRDQQGNGDGVNNIRMSTDLDEVFGHHIGSKSPESSSLKPGTENGEAMEDVRPALVADGKDITSSEQAGTPQLEVPAQEPPKDLEEAAGETKSQAEVERDLEASRIAAEEAAAAAASAAAAAAQEEAAEAERQRLRVAEAEARRKAEEAEARKRAEEEAIARKKEEEERQEQLRRDLEERRRRQEEQKRQEFLEFERRRREALPRALCETARMLDQNDPRVKGHQWLKQKFLPLYTVRSEQLDPNSIPDTRHDLWIPNFQVAGLLAVKDLKLAQYTSLERRTVTPHQRTRLWAVARLGLAFEYVVTAWNTSTELANEREREGKEKFMAMEDLFWVKLSDFEDQIFRHSHLSGLKMPKRPITLDISALLSLSRPAFSTSPPLDKPLTNGVKSYESTIADRVGI